MATGIFLGLGFVSFIVGTLMLMMVTKMMNVGESSWGKAFVINLVAALLSQATLWMKALSKGILGLIALIILAVMLKKSYDVSWLKMLGIWILWAAFTGIAMGIILVIGTISGVFAFSSLLSTI